MLDSFDVLVVGAGIVGAACALECALAGLSVGVLEGAEVGGGATAAGMGHVVVMDDGPAQCALTSYSSRLWDALVHEEPDQYEYDRCGTIWVASDELEMRAVYQKHAFYEAHTVPSEILDARALALLEPQLRPGLAGGLLVPGDSVIYAPRSAALLLARACRHGARLIRGTAARLVSNGLRLRDGAVLRSGTIVLANGIHVLDLAPELPIRAKKGHLAITDRYPGFVRHQLVELGYVTSAHASSGDSVAFNVQPRRTGQVLIGSSRQFDQATADVDYAILSRMLKRAFDYLPALDQLSCIRIWTGVRAATPDGLPLIGRHPFRPGVWLAAGHEGLGITTAPATAKLLVAQLLNQRSEIASEPYLPSRLVGETADV